MAYPDGEMRQFDTKDAISFVLVGVFFFLIFG